MNTLQLNTELANSNSAAKPFYRRKYNDQGPTFSQFHYELPIFHNREPVQVVLEARMDKGFFMANQYWTCYRRNYFQLSSSLQLMKDDSITDMSDITVMVGNQHQKVTNFYISLVAKVSTNDKSVDLVQHTAKRDKGPQQTPGPKKIKIGGSLSNVNSLTTTHAIATFERIQFKSATANNGKRRAQQQFFMLLIEVLADIEVDGNIIQRRVGFAISDHLVVRGRSPGHYSDTHVERAGMAAMQSEEMYAGLNEHNSMYFTPYSPNSMPNSNSSSVNGSPKMGQYEVAQQYVMDVPVRPSSVPMDFYPENQTVQSMEHFSNQMQKIQEQMSQQMTTYGEIQYVPHVPQDIHHCNQMRSAAPSPMMHHGYTEEQLYAMQQQQQHQQQIYYSMSAPGSRSTSPFQQHEIPPPQMPSENASQISGLEQ